MSTAKIKGRQVIWGIVAGAGDTHAAGIITRIGRKKAGDTEFVYDNEGFTITEIFYNDTDEVSVDVLCEAGTAQPENGDDVTIAGVLALVQTSDLLWEQKAVKKLNITAKKFVNLVEA
jgi:hypothetical protein